MCHEKRRSANLSNDAVAVVAVSVTLFLGGERSSRVFDLGVEREESGE